MYRFVTEPLSKVPYGKVRGTIFLLCRFVTYRYAEIGIDDNI
jgi:hypothetical protein